MNGKKNLLYLLQKKRIFLTLMKIYKKKLSKMARAGFPYEICKDVLKID